MVGKVKNNYKNGGSSSSSSSSCRNGGITTIDIDAPVPRVWEILLNLDDYPRIFDGCHSIENLTAAGSSSTSSSGRRPRRKKKSLNPIEAGATYREQRTVQGKTHTFIVSATIVDEATKTFAFALTLWNCTGTATHIVKDLDDGKKCRLILSHGIVPNGFYGKLYLWMFGRYVQNQIQSWVNSDLRDIQREAEKKSGIG